MRILLLSLIAAVLMMAGPARADEPADTIRSVIDSQIAAFQADDVDQAFTFASPKIQRMFGNPRNFGRMVREGYPMVWRPARYEMLKLGQSDGRTVQYVLFEDQSGRLHEAAYEMKLIDGEWRINGVYLREVPGVGT